MRKVTLMLLLLLATAIPSLATDDVLNNANTINNTTTTYTDVSGIKVSSDAVYSGNMAGASGTITLRNTNASGIYTTASGGYVTKVAVTWNSKTVTSQKRYITVYGKNEAYASVSDDDMGTSLGTIEYGTSSYKEIIGSYKYICLIANGALYLDNITVSWSDHPVEELVLAYPQASYTTQVGKGFASPELSVTVGGEARTVSGIKYSSDNTDVATVNASTGAVTVLSVGTANITASFAGDSYYCAASTSYALNVTVPTASFDFTNQKSLDPEGTSGTAYDLAGVTLSDTPVSLAFAQGTATSNYKPKVLDSNVLNLYSGNTMTASVPVGYVITAVNFTKSGSTFKITADCGSLDSQTWTASDKTTQSVVFTCGGSTKISSITVEYESVAVTPTPVIETESGNLTTLDKVIITCEDADATIYVVVDGADAVAYPAGGLSLSEGSHTVSAYAIKDGIKSANSESRAYNVSLVGDGLAWSVGVFNVNIDDSDFTAPVLSNPYGLSVTYSSSNTDVAEISADGALTIKAVGQAVITASFAGNSVYAASTVQYTLNVVNVTEHVITAETLGVNSGVYSVFTQTTDYAEYTAKTRQSPDNSDAFRVSRDSGIQSGFFISESIGQIGGLEIQIYTNKMAGGLEIYGSSDSYNSIDDLYVDGENLGTLIATVNGVGTLSENHTATTTITTSDDGTILTVTVPEDVITQAVSDCGYIAIRPANLELTDIKSIKIKYHVHKETDCKAPKFITADGAELYPGDKVELENRTAHATITYTLSHDGVADSKTYVYDSAEGIVLNEAGEWTVTASATKEGLTASGTVSINVTVKSLDVATIGEWFAKAKDDKAHAYRITGQVTVTVVNGSEMFIQDDGDAIRLQYAGESGSYSDTYSVGDRLTGVSGSLSSVNSMPYMVSPVIEERAEGSAMSPKVITPDQIVVDILGQYVKVERVKTSNGSSQQWTITNKSGVTGSMWNRYNSGSSGYTYKIAAPDDSQVYDIVGVVYCQSGTNYVIVPTADLAISERADAGLAWSEDNVDIIYKEGETSYDVPTIKCAADAKSLVTYASSNEEVASVSASGVITIKGYGTAQITATIPTSDYDYNPASATTTVNVIATNSKFDFTTKTYGYEVKTGNSFDKSMTLTVEPVTISIGGADGADAKVRFFSGTGGQDLRVNSGIITVSANDKYDITKITFTFSSAATSSSKNLTLNEDQVGTFDGSVWTGNSRSVTFTTTGAYLSSVSVEYADPKPKAVLEFVSDKVTVNVNETANVPAITEGSTQGLEIVYSISDDDAQYINISDGVITGLKMTESPITVSARTVETDDYAPATASFTVEVVDRAYVVAPVIDSEGGDLTTLDRVKVSCADASATIHVVIDEDDTVVSDGEFTIPVGEHSVYAYAQRGDYKSENTSVLTFNVVRVEPGISWNSEQSEFDVDVSTKDVSGLPALNNPGGFKVTYKSSNESVATVDADGAVTVLDMGMARITATFDETDIYAGAQCTYILNVVRYDTRVIAASDFDGLKGNEYTTQTKTYDSGDSYTVSAMIKSDNFQISKEKTAGIITTASLGRLYEIKFRVESASGKYAVAGSSTDYSSVDDLYDDDKRGTILLAGQNTTGDIVIDEETINSKIDDCRFMGIYGATNGAIQISSISLKYRVEKESECKTPTIVTAESAELWPGDKVEVMNHTTGATVLYEAQNTETGEVIEGTYDDAEGIVLAKAGTWTVRVWAQKEGLQDSPVGTATFSVNSVDVKNIREWLEKAKVKDNQSRYFTITGQVTVTVVNGQDMFIQDYSEGCLVKGTSKTAFSDYKVGDRLTGVSANYSSLGDLDQMILADDADITKVEGDALTPETIALTDITSANQGRYVKVFAVTVSELDNTNSNQFTITDNNRNTATFWDRYNRTDNYTYTVAAPVVGNMYDIVGVIYYNTSAGVCIIPTETLKDAEAASVTNVSFTEQDADNAMNHKDIGDSFYIESTNENNAACGFVDDVPAMIAVSDSRIKVGSNDHTKAISRITFTALSDFSVKPRFSDIQLEDKTDDDEETPQGSFTINGKSLVWAASDGHFANSFEFIVDQEIQISHVEIEWAWVSPKLVSYKITDKDISLILKKGHHLYYKINHKSNAAPRRVVVNTDGMTDVDEDAQTDEWTTTDLDDGTVKYTYDIVDNMSVGDSAAASIVNGPLSNNKIDWARGESGITTGVSDVSVDSISDDAVIYTLQGVRVSADRLTPGLYIRRQGSSAQKILIK